MIHDQTGDPARVWTGTRHEPSPQAPVEAAELSEERSTEVRARGCILSAARWGQAFLPSWTVLSPGRSPKKPSHSCMWASSALALLRCPACRSTLDQVPQR